MSKEGMPEIDLSKIQIALYKKFQELDAQLESLTNSEDASGNAEKKLRARYDSYYKVVKSLIDLAAAKRSREPTESEEIDLFDRLKKSLEKRAQAQEKRTMMLKKDYIENEKQLHALSNLRNKLAPND